MAVSLSSLNGSNGFEIDGEFGGDYSGGSVSGAGDVNGDGFADLLIGAAGADPKGISSGATYVVFGTGGTFPAALNVSSLDGSNGFQITGEAAGDGFGYDVSGAGDVNGDGFDDLIIGADGVDSEGRPGIGAAYVVFGNDTGFSATLSVFALDGTNGFKMVGEAQGDRLGSSVSGAGDVNGDGFDDLIIGTGAFAASPSYVIFGQAAGFAPTVDLSRLQGSNGFKVVGIYDTFGGSVGGAGDVNHDQFDDLIIGAPSRDASGFTSETSYVIFGKPAGFLPTLNVSTLDGKTGFKLQGEKDPDFINGSGDVSSAGDVNGDGIDDLLIAADGFTPNDSSGGESYVVFGKAAGFDATFDLSTLNGANGFKIAGERGGDYSAGSVSAAGDFNGDGFGDLLIGNPGDDPNGALNSGAGYVVFGKFSGFTAVVKLSALNGVNGFKLPGAAEDDRAGRSVSAAGDVNGDGFADVIIGADGAGADGTSAGASYVVFGTAAISASVDLLQQKRSITFTEPDGDRTTISISKGNINREKITLELDSGGGALLSHLALTGKGANKGARVSITAEAGVLLAPSIAGGIGNAGIPNIGTVDLPNSGGPKRVNIGGNVQEVNVPAGAHMKVFKVHSLGGGIDLFPDIPSQFTGAGTIAKVVVKEDVTDYTLGIPGAVDQLVVKGSIRGSTLTFAKPLQQLTVNVDVEESTFTFARTLVALLVRGNLSETEVIARQMGSVGITGVLRASSLVAGATAGLDGIFGTVDDEFVGSGRPGVVASLARITVGSVEGSATPGDGFGIVAEKISRLNIGGTPVALTPGAHNDLAPKPLLPDGSTNDFFAREVAPSV